MKLTIYKAIITILLYYIAIAYIYIYILTIYIQIYDILSSSLLDTELIVTERRTHEGHTTTQVNISRATCNSI